MSSKSASSSETDSSIGNLLKWRRVGISFWSFVALIGVSVVGGVSWDLFLLVLVPLLFLRVHLLSSALHKSLGVKYYTKLMLFGIDAISFGVIFISKEWSTYVILPWPSNPPPST